MNSNTLSPALVTLTHHRCMINSKHLSTPKTHSKSYLKSQWTVTVVDSWWREACWWTKLGLVHHDNSECPLRLDTQCFLWHVYVSFLVDTMWIHNLLGMYWQMAVNIQTFTPFSGVSLILDWNMEWNHKYAHLQLTCVIGAGWSTYYVSRALISSEAVWVSVADTHLDVIARRWGFTWPIRCY